MTETPSTSMSATSGTGSRLDRLGFRGWGALLVLCGAIFLEGADIGMVTVALPAIRADLGLTTGELQWVMSAYVLGYGGFMLLGGRVADLFGRRRVFLAALTLFVIFSGLGGIATEGWLLIVARFVTGMMAAFMTPAGLSMITTAFDEGPLRNRALLIYSGTAAGGFSLGLVIGGLLSALGWRWVFFAPVILASVILFAALAFIPKAAPPVSRGSLDVPGALTITSAILLLVFAVERASHVELPWTIGTLALVAALLAAFVAIESRVRNPLVRLGILRSGPLLRANTSALLFSGAYSSFQFVLVLVLQELLGWSAIQTSLLLIVVAIDTVLSPTLTPLLVRRFGTRRVILAGLLIAAAAYALILPVGLDWSYLSFIPSVLVLGLAFSLAYGPLTIAATDGVRDEEQGLASGLLYTMFQFGAALGLSTVASFIAVTSIAGSDESDTLDAYRPAFFIPLGAMVIAIAIAATGRRARR